MYFDPSRDFLRPLAPDKFFDKQFLEICPKPLEISKKMYSIKFVDL